MADNATVSTGDLNLGAVTIDTKEVAAGVHRQRVYAQDDTFSAATQPGTAVAVGTSSTSVLAANASRRGWVLSWPSTATGVLWVRLGGGTAVAGAGVAVQPGGSMSWPGYTGAVTAIATAGGSSVGVVEV